MTIKNLFLESKAFGREKSSMVYGPQKVRILSKLSTWTCLQRRSRRSKDTLGKTWGNGLGTSKAHPTPHHPERRKTRGCGWWIEKNSRTIDEIQLDWTQIQLLVKRTSYLHGLFLKERKNYIHGKYEHKHPWIYLCSYMWRHISSQPWSQSKDLLYNIYICIIDIIYILHIFIFVLYASIRCVLF